MKRTRFFLLTSLVLLWPALVTAQAVSAGDGFQPVPSAREYVETTGDNRRSFLWTLQATDGWLLTSRQNREVHTTHHDKSLRTERWSLVRPDTNTSVTAWREGETLYVQGTLEGREFRASHRLGELPWYQALSLSLRKHLGDRSPGQDFWTLRPDTLALHRLEIAVISRESLQQGDNKVPAYRVEVRPTGWKSAFWKGAYWFRRENREFIRYRGASGPPGWPATVIEPARGDMDK